MPCLRKWVAGRTRRRIERQRIKIKEKIEGQQNRSTDKKVFATKLDNLSLVPCVVVLLHPQVHAVMIIEVVVIKEKN